jgi:hypothetical protein
VLPSSGRMVGFQSLIKTEERKLSSISAMLVDSSINRHNLVDSNRHPLTALGTHNRHPRIQ